LALVRKRRFLQVRSFAASLLPPLWQRRTYLRSGCANIRIGNESASQLANSQTPVWDCKAAIFAAVSFIGGQDGRHTIPFLLSSPSSDAGRGLPMQGALARCRSERARIFIVSRITVAEPCPTCSSPTRCRPR